MASAEVFRQVIALSKKSKCRGATCSKSKPLLERKADCFSDPQVFSFNGRIKPWDVVPDLLNLFIKHFLHEDVHDFDVRWAKHYYAQLLSTDIPSIVMPEGLCKVRVNVSLSSMVRCRAIVMQTQTGTRAHIERRFRGIS